MHTCPHCNQPLTVNISQTRRRFNHDEAAALIKAGATQTEVANHYGVTRQAINAMMKTRNDDFKLIVTDPRF